MSINLLTSGGKNTKEIDARNARELDDMLTWIALCDGGEDKRIDWRLFDSAFFFGRQSGISPEFDHIDVNRKGKELSSWGAKFVMMCDDRLDRYELIRVIEFSESESALKIALEPNSWEISDAHAVQIEAIGIDDEAKAYRNGRMHVYRKNGRLYLPVGLTEIECKYADVVIANSILHSHAFENQWSVYCRMAPRTPSIGFFTDPTGIKEFLKFREIPDGKNRRDAVIHWVSQHWRQKRQDPELEVYVRKHLRGTNILRWHGMEIEVNIPAADRAAIDREKDRRKRLAPDVLFSRLRAAHKKSNKNR